MKAFIMGKRDAVTAEAIFLSAWIRPKSRMTRKARISCTNLRPGPALRDIRAARCGPASLQTVRLAGALWGLPACGRGRADGPVGDVEGAEVDKGHKDDEDVQVVPAVAGEDGEPVGVGVDEQLAREVGGEEEVEAVHHVAELRVGSVLEDQLAPVLRLEDAHQEVLRRGHISEG